MNGHYGIERRYIVTGCVSLDLNTMHFIVVWKKGNALKCTGVNGCNGLNKGQGCTIYTFNNIIKAQVWLSKWSSKGENY